MEHRRERDGGDALPQWVARPVDAPPQGGSRTKTSPRWSALAAVALILLVQVWLLEKAVDHLASGEFGPVPGLSLQLIALSIVAYVIYRREAGPDAGSD